MVTLNTNGQTRTETRIKICSLPFSTLVALLTMDGQHSYKFEGFPQDSRVIGARLRDDPSRIELVLYHPEFPICLGEPELIKVTAKMVS